MKQWMVFVVVLAASPSAWAEDAGGAVPISDAGMPMEDVPPWKSCAVDTDCAADESCQNGTCQWAGAACEKIADCNPGEACVDSHCQWIGPPCSTEDDCSPFDDCVGAFCIYKGPPCAAKDECSPMEACDDGHCVWVGCSSDADCGKGSTCDVQAKWCSSVGCSQSSDCPNDGSACIYGLCGDPKGLCQKPEDCQTLTMCSLGSSGAEAKPAPAQDGGGVSIDTSGDDAIFWGGDPWGQCVIDVAALPEDATCKALCAQAAECAAVMNGGGAPDPAADGGGAPADASGFVPPPEDAGAWTPSPEYIAWIEKTCLATCNYAVAAGVAGTTVSDLAACLEGKADCAAMDAECGDEGEAWSKLMSEVPMLPSEGFEPPFDPGGDVDWGDGTSIGAETQEPGTDTGSSGNADVGLPIGTGDGEAVSDLYDPGPGGSDVSAAGPDAGGPGGNADGGSTTPAPSSGSGGCSSAAAPAAPWMALLVLLALVSLRRKPQAAS